MILKSAGLGYKKEPFQAESETLSVDCRHTGKDRRNNKDFEVGQMHNPTLTGFCEAR